MMFSRIAIVSLGLIASLASFSVKAQENTTVVEKYVVVSPAPKGECVSVASHWEGNIWVAAHDECKYENRSEGVMWINAYWSCTSSTPDGNCSTWVLVPGHWVAK